MGTRLALPGTLRGSVAVLSKIAHVLSVAVVVLPIAASAAEHVDRSPYGQAMRWYFDAAAAGNPQAQFMLGLKYETGTDVARDYRTAADWYERAARQGYPEAQFKLASLLERGLGRSADAAAAAQWYERAARAGFAPAQYNLAVLILNSAKTDEDRVAGLTWLIRARDQGVTAAAEFLARIEAQWPEELVAAARQRAAEQAPDANPNSKP